MFPKIFFYHIFRRRNEIELTVDSIFLKYANDTVFTAVSKCMKSQIIIIVALLVHVSRIGNKIVVMATCMHLYPDRSCSSGMLVSCYMYLV